MNLRFTRFVLFALLIFPCFGFSQGEFNNWYFGSHAGLDFNSGSPVSLTNAPSTFNIEGYSSSVSDSLGNLLFFANEFYVYNRNMQVMPNGSLIGSWQFGQQPMFAVKKMDEDSVYFLFMMDVDSTVMNQNPKGLTYTIVDMKLDGGLGNVPTGQTGIPVAGALQTKDMLTGTRAQNNKDAWIVARKFKNSTQYLAYHITPAGIDMTPVISNSLVMLHWPILPNGQNGEMMRFSPDGTRFITVYDSVSEFCQFNSSTGQITPMFYFNTLNTSNGEFATAEFSIDNRFLYISRWDGYCPCMKIYQYDASKTDSLQFIQSEVLIHQDHLYPSQLQRGPDHKIYCTHESKDSVDVINFPTVQGLGCDYQPRVVWLQGRICLQGFVQHLERYYVYIHNTGHCQGLPVNFTSAIWPQPDSIHWDFGDPASGPENYSYIQNPAHTYLVPGTYNITLFVRHIDKRTDTAWRQITINPTYTPSLGPDKSVCTGNSVTFDAGACTGCTYQWTDLTTMLPVWSSQTYTTSQAGTYEAAVTNTYGCTGRDTVQLITNPPPDITNNPLSKTICSGESTNIALTSNQPGTNFYWTASLNSGNITGFSADSGLVINQILINNGASAGIVTYHITPKVGGCAGTAVVFPVTVDAGDSVKVSISASTNNVCAGTPVSFTATPTNGGLTPTFHWKVNGSATGSNSPNFTYSPASGDLVSCILTSSINVCITNNPATSNTIQMIVNPLNPVSVAISPSANPVCSGATVTFTATPGNGGTTPVYLWKVNGISVGTNSTTYSYSPVSGDLVSCILTSNIICPSGNPATSNTITMTVNPNLPVSVAIFASANPFCQGSAVTFTATPTNGGTSPSYLWKVNGIIVGPNNPLFTYIPVSGDLVSCILTSNIACPTGNPATSNTITMIQNNNVPAGVSIVASTNPFCPGNSVTFTATPVNGGANPAYQWKVNGVNAGTNSTTYSYNPLNGDSVRCIMTSNLNCVSGNPASSAKIIMSGTLASVVTFTRCFDSITITTAQPFKLKGGIPLGGTYAGLGVSGGIFHPAIAGIGTHQITYTYTNAALCAASASVTIVTIVTPVTTCGQNFIDIRDGKSYATVKIGTQCWMAEDLNYGTEIPSDQSQRDNCIDEKYTVHSSLFTAHSYYQWDELMNYDETVSTQGLCPPGWHVPTEADWKTLFAHYISNGFAGSPLKYSGFSGFNAILSGARHLNKNWDYQGFATFFWSSTIHGTNKAWAHGMNDINPSVSIYPSFRDNAFSVRCIHD